MPPSHARITNIQPVSHIRAEGIPISGKPYIMNDNAFLSKYVKNDPAGAAHEFSGVSASEKVVYKYGKPQRRS